MVKSRIEPKSIGVSKNFPNRSALTSGHNLQLWAVGLSIELSKRLHEDQAKVNFFVLLKIEYFKQLFI